MADSVDPTGGALELARSAAPAPARRRRGGWAAAGGGLVQPAGVGGGALGLARSLARWLAGRRPPASAGVEVTTRRVTVVKDAGTSVLVHRVETALVVRTLGVARGWPADDQQRPGSKGQQR